MDAANEQRILTRIRKLANRWQDRHRTILLEYDDYYSIGLQAYYAVRDQWAGSDPLLIEKIAVQRANWDMADAARTSAKYLRKELIDRSVDHEIAMKNRIDPRTTREDPELKIDDLRSLLAHSLPQHQAQIAILFLVDGYSLPEIAQQLQLPKSTVSYYWESARQEMKKNPRIMRFAHDCQYGTP